MSSCHKPRTSLPPNDPPKRPEKSPNVKFKFFSNISRNEFSTVFRPAKRRWRKIKSLTLFRAPSGVRKSSSSAWKIQDRPAIGAFQKEDLLLNFFSDSSSPTILFLFSLTSQQASTSVEFRGSKWKELRFTCCVQLLFRKLN